MTNPSARPQVRRRLSAAVARRAGVLQAATLRVPDGEGRRLVVRRPQVGAGGQAEQWLVRARALHTAPPLCPFPASPTPCLASSARPRASPPARAGTARRLGPTAPPAAPTPSPAVSPSSMTCTRGTGRTAWSGSSAPTAGGVVLRRRVRLVDGRCLLRRVPSVRGKPEGEACERTPPRRCRTSRCPRDQPVSAWNGGMSALDEARPPPSGSTTSASGSQRASSTSGATRPTTRRKRTSRPQEWYGEPVTPSGYDTCPEVYPSRRMTTPTLSTRAPKIRATAAAARTDAAASAAAAAASGRAAQTLSFAAASASHSPRQRSRGAAHGVGRRRRAGGVAIACAALAAIPRRRRDDTFAPPRHASLARPRGAAPRLRGRLPPGG